MNNKRIYLIISMLLVVIVAAVIIYRKINPNLNKNQIEHIISIISNDKKIDAVTSSFCYKNGVCIDKNNFRDFNYDVVSSNYGSKLYIDNLDGSINSVKIFDYIKKEYTDIIIQYTNDYIITPNDSGKYIFIINANYEGKIIEYYFMVNIE